MLPKVIIFQEQSYFNYNARSIFDVIINIEEYPKFLPWCHSIKIISCDTSKIVAQCTMKFQSIIAEYESEINFCPPSKNTDGYINTTSNKGAFEYLKNSWQFVSKNTNKTLVKFDIECKFKSKLAHYTTTLVYKKAQKKIIQAFKNQIKTVIKI